MAYLHSFSTKLWALPVLLAAAGTPALAQTVYTPVTLTATSFTADVIANGSATALVSTTNGFDTGGTDIQYCLVAADFVSPTRGAATRGLPASRTLTSPSVSGLTFQLQPYTGFNSLRIPGTGTGALTLATPQAAQSVWLCAATGNGSGTNPVTLTVLFTDGTTQIFTQNISDWFGGTNFVANNLGRVGRPNDQFDNTAGEPRLYQFELALAAANYGKLISGVAVNKTQPTGVTTATVFNGLALTLASPCNLPTVTASAAATSVCAGQSTLLTAVRTGGSGTITGQWQSSPDGVTWTDIANATGLTYVATPAATTRYRYRVLCAAGPSGTSNVLTVTVVVPSATLAYANASYCRTGTTGVPTTATPAGGTFSASPSGLSLNAATGDINLAASAAGTYTVSYLSGGQCPATATFTLTVVAPNVVLVYPTTTFCRVGTSGAPAAAPAGGTFSSTPGLALNASTGVLDLANSAAGTYTITYLSSGQCPTAATASVTVKSDALPIFPNVLTPNGDGKNDVLKLSFAYPVADLNNYRLLVFNRWGRKMYEGSNPAQGWAPTDNSGGTYYYTVDYTDCAGRPQHYKGWVEVVK